MTLPLFWRGHGNRPGDGVKIDFVFDTICPWCYVGKRRLERALAQRPGLLPNLHWRPFILNPDLPLGGVDHHTYLSRKFGSMARAQRMHGTVIKAGKGEGIDFDFDRILRVPNTLHSHRLIRFAGRSGYDWAAVEAVYHAYFLDGRDIGDMAELAKIAGEIGLSAEDTADYLHSDADITATLNDNAHTHRLGVTGIPCLIIDGRYALAGAQDADILGRLMDIAREDDVEAAAS
jgi:predicted DsbA family dithiol-disulfide isomerase